jgi:hypothetical protein
MLNFWYSWLIRIVFLCISLRDYPRLEDNKVFCMFDFYLMDIFILDSRITEFARTLCNINFDRYLRLEDNILQ